ncbi:hypothetical protein ACQCX5_03680 [Propionibacteriaceae bacterium G57]|uniref:hypothetical protein n=1 Tax=Aestuariimicrobium sp. G57 TaxID=3418485 RepID=UPI003DA75CEE
MAATVLLSGCQDKPVTTPAPTVSPILQTASATSSPTPPSTAPTPSQTLISTRPTSSTELEALADEAEQVYVAYKKLRLKYEAQGGIDGPLPEDLKQYVAGTESRAVETVLRSVHQKGTKLEKVDRMTFKRVGTFSDDLEENAIIGIQMCDDASQVVFKDGKGSSTRASSLMYWSELGRGPAGTLQVVYSEVKEVASCDA